MMPPLIRFHARAATPLSPHFALHFELRRHAITPLEMIYDFSDYASQTFSSRYFDIFAFDAAMLIQASFRHCYFASTWRYCRHFRATPLFAYTPLPADIYFRLFSAGFLAHFDISLFSLRQPARLFSPS
jgi:hypothetical protein